MQFSRDAGGSGGGSRHRYPGDLREHIWVYGASGDGEIDEDSPIGLPDHLYTASKLAGEMYCTSYAELYDVPTRSSASGSLTDRGRGPRR